MKDKSAKRAKGKRPCGDGKHRESAAAFDKYMAEAYCQRGIHCDGT
jgi:hypothetical protein